MIMLKKHKFLIIGCVIVTAALIYSLEAAFTVLGGFVAVLFGDNQRKRTELEVKADKIKEVEQDAQAVRAQLDRINKTSEAAQEEIVTQKEREVDQWLDS
jgi:galactokinase/mevalonate kinase-like predicted kinase